MGASAARITAADFLTPPELCDRRLAAHPAGRIGGVRVELVADRAETRLGACYQQVPLRVLPPFRFAPLQPALLYLLNPTAGLMDGDAHLVELTARVRSCTLVVGQSATRIHPSLGGFSTQQWQVSVEAGAVLVVLPGPAIPFRGCRYYQRVTVDLAPGAGFVWGDVWLSGRYARGAASERFQFATLIQELTVQRADRLVFRDRFCWQGPWDDDQAAWHFGGGSACGSLFMTGSVPAVLPEDEAPFTGAWSPTAWGDTCVRWCGPSETVTARVVETALRMAAALAGSTQEGLSTLRQEIGPAHWFFTGSTAYVDRTQ